MKIAIDAGHGPNTAGKRCPDDSMREFSFNSVVARYVRDGLEAYAGVTVKFTHADDGSRDVPLSERVRSANDWSADIFVSIHANAAGSGWNSAAGIETFTAVNASAASVTLAESVQRMLIAATGRPNRGIKKSDFYVIKNTRMPAILCECGFMTNQTEAALLKSDDYRRKCAAAIVSAIAGVYGLKRKGGDDMENAEVYVNGKRIADGKYDAAAGVVYVPVRAVAESFGAAVNWDGNKRRVDVTRTE